MVTLRIVVSDCIALLTLGTTAIVLKFGNIQPYLRGFYCYDESIRYPYKVSILYYDTID